MTQRWLIWSEERDRQARSVPGGWKLRAHDASGMTRETQAEYGIEVMPVSEHEAVLERLREEAHRDQTVESTP